jgi:hypothetical protein
MNYFDDSSCWQRTLRDAVKGSSRSNVASATLVSTISVGKVREVDVMSVTLIPAILTGDKEISDRANCSDCIGVESVDPAMVVLESMPEM